MQAFRTSPAHQQQSNALQQFGGRISPFGEKNVGLAFVLISVDLSGKQDCRRLGRDALDPVDQFSPVHGRHHQVAQYQIHSALLEFLEGLGGAGPGNHPIAAGFQDYLSDGQGLFVVVNAENRPFGFHRLSEVAARNGSPEHGAGPARTKTKLFKKIGQRAVRIVES